PVQRPDSPVAGLKTLDQILDSDHVRLHISSRWPVAAGAGQKGQDGQRFESHPATTSGGGAPPVINHSTLCQQQEAEYLFKLRRTTQLDTRASGQRSQHHNSIAPGVSTCLFQVVAAAS